MIQASEDHDHASRERLKKWRDTLLQNKVMITGYAPHFT